MTGINDLKVNPDFNRVIYRIDVMTSFYTLFVKCNKVKHCIRVEPTNCIANAMEEKTVSTIFSIHSRRK